LRARDACIFFAVAGIGAGCGLEARGRAIEGAGGDASVPRADKDGGADASGNGLVEGGPNDGSPQDAACTGLACVPTSCPSGQSYCPETGTCVPSCETGCGQHFVLCLVCPGGGPMVRVCDVFGGLCTAGLYDHCPCTSGAGDCPPGGGRSNQRCSIGYCRSCGEPTTGGADCQNANECCSSTGRCTCG
jgi:hypothetical protein